MVHATPGKGTTVLATLPLDAVPAQRELSRIAAKAGYFLLRSTPWRSEP